MIEIEQELRILNTFLPSGGAWDAKTIEDSNLRNLLYALISMFNKVKEYSSSLSQELNIMNITSNTITQWEQLAGIPSFIFNQDPSLLSLEQRISQVITQLVGLNVRTQDEIADFIKILLPEVTNVNFYNASTTNKFDFNFITFRFGSDNQLKTLVLIELEGIESTGFPYTFDFTFEQPYSQIEEFLNYIIPFPFTYEIITDSEQTEDEEYLLDIDENYIIDIDGNYLN